MTYRIFEVTPQGEASERRRRDVPVAIERRAQGVHSRMKPEMSEWEKLRARLGNADSMPPERPPSSRR